MQTTTPQADPPEYVLTAGWICSGTEVANDQTYNASVYSTASFPVQQGPTFIPYNELTEEIVLGWCWDNGVNKDATEAAVQQNIDLQINPVVIQPPLPWVVPQA